MDGCNSFFGHKWGKWGAPTEYAHTEIPGAVLLKQQRRCERCDMLQFYTVVNLSAKRND